MLVLEVSFKSMKEETEVLQFGVFSVRCCGMLITLNFTECSGNCLSAYPDQAMKSLCKIL